MTDNARVLSWLENLTDEAPSDATMTAPQDSFANESGLTAAYNLRYDAPKMKSAIEFFVDSYQKKVAEAQAYLPELKDRVDRWHAYEERMAQDASYDERLDRLFPEAEQSTASVRSKYDSIEASLEKDISTQISALKDEENELRRSIAEGCKLLAADSRRLNDLVECERQLDACLTAFSSSNNNGQHDVLKHLEGLRPMFEKLGFKDELDTILAKM